MEADGKPKQQCLEQLVCRAEGRYADIFLLFQIFCPARRNEMTI